MGVKWTRPVKGYQDSSCGQYEMRREHDHWFQGKEMCVWVLRFDQHGKFDGDIGVVRRCEDKKQCRNAADEHHELLSHGINQCDIMDRALGCIYGLLVGDALGAPFEFCSEGSYEVPEEGEYATGGMHDSYGGEWTDDGAMALALADSMTSGWSRLDQLDKYVEWQEMGKYQGRGHCFDIGTTTAGALDRYRESGDPDFAGAPIGRRCAGNGSIMRLAPVPVYCALSYGSDQQALSQAWDLGVASSTTTHGNFECLMASGFLSVLLCGLIRHGTDPFSVPQVYVVPDHILERVPARMKKMWTEPSDPRDKPEGFRPAVSGYVNETLQAAMWSYWEVHKSGPWELEERTFGSIVREAVSLGGDTDTVGAVAGQLAGATFGLSGIHKGWIDGLDHKEMAEEIIDRLVKESE